MLGNVGFIYVSFLRYILEHNVLINHICITFSEQIAVSCPVAGESYYLVKFWLECCPALEIFLLQHKQPQGLMDWGIFLSKIAIQYNADITVTDENNDSENDQNAVNTTDKITIIIRIVSLSQIEAKSNCRYFADGIYFLLRKLLYFIPILLGGVFNNPNYNNPTLVYILAWCWTSDKPFSKPMLESLLWFKWVNRPWWHCDHVIMGAIASQITSLTIVYSSVYSDADQRKHQSSASLAFVWGIHRGPVHSPHKWTVTRKMFTFDDVIMSK